ncbi:MAG: toll/interleukin-1 receptor domain-containing protein [Paludibacteraceae bacterium]|nr:toll/interleukin-1 receptor domain-containing protein [Paludibacteraceae bacterium]
MREIFESGSFSHYRIANLNESRRQTKLFSEGGTITAKTTVFISHKHDDLTELQDIIGFLQNEYNVQVYIDSRDPNMPVTTSGETAKKIKDIIKRSNRFILLATEGAIESKWCNWELGYGDALKYKDKIAIFPIKPKNSCDWNYKGNEYMQIYPYIAYCDDYDIYKDGSKIQEGYYVVTMQPNGEKTITSLSQWLKKNIFK